MRALIDHHLDVDSPLHRWNPRSKVVAFGLLALAMCMVSDWRLALGNIALAMLLLVSARLPVGLVMRRLLPLIIMLAVFAGLCTVPGGPGIRFAALVSLRCLAVAIVAAVLLGTTPMKRLFDALRRLHVPARIVEMTMLAHRLVYAASAEMDAMSRSAAARGLQLHARPRELRVVGGLAGTLMLRGFARSDRLYRAMLARGYRGQLRTLDAPGPTRADHAKLAGAVLLSALMLTARWW